MQHTPLISTIVIGLVLAFVFGATLHRLRISPIVGYLLAGVVMGPFTPGYVADQALANDLAEIGVILLMFGVGLHFSLDDLLSVKAIAIPGAVAQIVAATLMGMALAWLLGWPASGGVVFGLALSVASTVVLLRALQERRLLETERGRIAIGWLIVEDLAMVLALVLLPVLAGLSGGAAGNWQTVALPLALTFGKVVAFVAFMLIVGKRVIPWLLHYVAHTGSRELFRLSVLAVALGVAYGASELFGMSFALGAFFAGMILSESELSQRAAQESLPLRDAFAVLFFVSVGMLFDPAIVLRQPLPVLATIAIILLGKSFAAFVIVRLFGHPNSTAMTVSASLAQIGEFSFILAGLGVSLSLLPAAGRDLILAGAILSIVLNPLCFAALGRWLDRATPAAPTGAEAARKQTAREPLPATSLRDHVVLVGHGRVGGYISRVLRDRAIPFLVVEDDREIVARLREQHIEVIFSNAADPEVVPAANIAGARCLLVAIPDAFEGGQVVEQARKANTSLPIIARAHSQEEIEHLKRHGASIVVMGEHEIAKTMIADIPARAGS
ncbi:MAG TPA: YbaL family putative K(+) efflux transporter [Pseudorhodoplanes sp.]|jgi:CPA2 family monovalent cation:H+ antiporter-2|nr:YbaL family putative K(+) efflux transporter [Pseudorhodoplanes sp.]